MEFRNIIRGWFTTLLGCVLMIIAIYAWWEGDDWWEIGVPFVAGLILLFMQDQLSNFFNRIFDIIIQALKEKFNKQ